MFTNFNGCVAKKDPEREWLYVVYAPDGEFICSGLSKSDIEMFGFSERPEGNRVDTLVNSLLQSTQNQWKDIIVKHFPINEAKIWDYLKDKDYSVDQIEVLKRFTQDFNLLPQK